MYSYVHTNKKQTNKRTNKYTNKANIHTCLHAFVHLHAYTHTIYTIHKYIQAFKYLYVCMYVLYIWCFILVCLFLSCVRCAYMYVYMYLHTHIMCAIYTKQTTYKHAYSTYDPVPVPAYKSVCVTVSKPVLNTHKSVNKKMLEVNFTIKQHNITRMQCTHTLVTKEKIFF